MEDCRSARAVALAGNARERSGHVVRTTCVPYPAAREAFAILGFETRAIAHRPSRFDTRLLELHGPCPDAWIPRRFRLSEPHRRCEFARTSRTATISRPDSTCIRL